MIKIELQFETGAEARKALEELLGGSLTISIEKPEIAIKDEKIAENFEAQKTETQETQKPEKKRRTKAEIAADETKETVEPEPTIEQANEGESETKQPEQSSITKEMLQVKAVELIRGGKKDQVTATIKSFDADSISQPDKKPVKVEDYAALMDAFNKI